MSQILKQIRALEHQKAQDKYLLQQQEIIQKQELKQYNAIDEDGTPFYFTYDFGSGHLYIKTTIIYNFQELNLEGTIQ